MTIYKLKFVREALREWRKLDPAIQAQLNRKLAERLERPRVPASKMSGWPDCYRIKLRRAGIRLIYEVDDTIVTVFVVSVGRRDKDDAYRKFEHRMRRYGG